MRGPFFKSFNYEIHVYPYICGTVVYPVGLIAQSGSCYLTLAVTIERYLAVCWPLKARHLCSQVRLVQILKLLP